jgi:hypothetical protein
MANCNPLFQEFNKLIRLDDDRRVNLREKRNNLRDRIQGGFSEVRKLRVINENLQVSIEEEIEFQSQGSYVMDTIINPSRQEDEYDLDDGVYFFGKRNRGSRPSPDDFHAFIIESIRKGKGQNEIEAIVDKDTCVRVRYKGKNGDYNYHVDIPIYYAINPKEPDLADKKESWHTSSPVDFIVWFEGLVKSGFKAEFILERKLYNDQYETWLNDRRKKDHQLRRVVRYLKAWGDHLKGDMPPGVVMTILAGSDNNYAPDDRDDVCMHNTLGNIKNWLDQNGFRCPRPTTPKGDDLFAHYSQTKKDFFKKALESFFLSADQALQSANQKEACLKWQKHLGHRFPCQLAKDEIEGSKAYVAPAVIRSDNSKSA